MAASEDEHDETQKQPAEVLYRKRCQACNLIKKETLAQCFLWIYEIFKNTFFTEYLWTTASRNQGTNVIFEWLDMNYVGNPSK